VSEVWQRIKDYANRTTAGVANRVSDLLMTRMGRELASCAPARPISVRPQFSIPLLRVHIAGAVQASDLTAVIEEMGNEFNRYVFVKVRHNYWVKSDRFCVQCCMYFGVCSKERALTQEPRKLATVQLHGTRSMQSVLG
jgi:hypothetical protein